jgi:hypothetical protein
MLAAAFRKVANLTNPPSALLKLAIIRRVWARSTSHGATMEELMAATGWLAHTALPEPEGTGKAGFNRDGENHS